MAPICTELGIFLIRREDVVNSLQHIEQFLEEYVAGKHLGRFSSILEILEQLWMQFEEVQYEITELDEDDQLKEEINKVDADFENKYYAIRATLVGRLPCIRRKDSGLKNTMNRCSRLVSSNTAGGKNKRLDVDHGNELLEMGEKLVEGTNMETLVRQALETSKVTTQCEKDALDMEVLWKQWNIDGKERNLDTEKFMDLWNIEINTSGSSVEGKLKDGLDERKLGAEFGNRDQTGDYSTGEKRLRTTQRRVKRKGILCIHHNVKYRRETNIVLVAETGLPRTWKIITKDSCKIALISLLQRCQITLKSFP